MVNWKIKWNCHSFLSLLQGAGTVQYPIPSEEQMGLCHVHVILKTTVGLQDFSRRPGVLMPFLYCPKVIDRERGRECADSIYHLALNTAQPFLPRRQTLSPRCSDHCFSRSYLPFVPTQGRHRVPRADARFQMSCPPPCDISLHSMWLYSPSRVGPGEMPPPVIRWQSPLVREASNKLEISVNFVTQATGKSCLVSLFPSTGLLARPIKHH